MRYLLKTVLLASALIVYGSAAPRGALAAGKNPALQPPKPSENKAAGDSSSALEVLKKIKGGAGTIVFTRKPTTGEENEREIHLLDTKTGAIKRLTKNKYWDNYARLSPDHTKVVFESIRRDLDGDGKLTDEDRDIYIMNADGSGQRVLLDDKNFKGHPQWSPDGSKILFASKRKGYPDIFVSDADGKGLKQLTDSGDAVDPAWSPDGKQIVYVRFHRKLFTDMTNLPTDLWIMNADGSGKRLLLGSESGMKSEGFKHAMYDPAWSPDGKWIAFMRRMGTKGNYGLGVWHIFIVKPDGTGMQNLNEGTAVFFGYPHWSSDSRLLVVWGFDTRTYPRPHLMLIDISSREIWSLTEDQRYNDEMPYWR